MLWVELWLRAVREPALRPVAARLYGRYRDWVAGLIRAGVETGEFRADADPEALADLAMALLDGTGVRALIQDPAMEVESARDAGRAAAGGRARARSGRPPSEVRPRSVPDRPLRDGAGSGVT